jgi:hypothetical protein
VSDTPPQHVPDRFRATVHGAVFADRARHLDDLRPGDPLLLVPDPPDAEVPAVWVHLAAGDPVGHLPPEIAAALAPWMLGGGRARATVLEVGGEEVPSWRRLLVEVVCG